MSDEEKTELRKHLDVINSIQDFLWKLHHKIPDAKLADTIWQCSLQIEHALGQINQKLLGKPGYYEADK